MPQRISGQENTDLHQENRHLYKAALTLRIISPKLVNVYLFKK